MLMNPFIMFARVPPRHVPTYMCAVSRTSLILLSLLPLSKLIPPAPSTSTVQSQSRAPAIRRMGCTCTREWG